MLSIVLLESNTIRAAHIEDGTNYKIAIIGIIGVIVTAWATYEAAKEQIHSSNESTQEQVKSSNDSTKKQLKEESKLNDKRLQNSDNHFKEEQSNKYLIWSYQYLSKVKNYMGGIRDDLFNSYNIIKNEKPCDMVTVNRTKGKYIIEQLDNSINDLPDDILDMISDVNIIVRYIIQIFNFNTYKLDKERKLNISRCLSKLHNDLSGISHNATQSRTEILIHSKQILSDICDNKINGIFKNYLNRLEYIGHDLDNCMDEVHHIQNLLTGADTSYDEVEHIIKNWAPRK